MNGLLLILGIVWLAVSLSQRGQVRPPHRRPYDPYIDDYPYWESRHRPRPCCPRRDCCEHCPFWD